MLFPVPHKKMEAISRFRFIAKCDCGHIHKFKITDINLNNSKGTTVEFIAVYKCPKCGLNYDGIFQNITERNQHSKFGIFISILLFIILFYGGHYLYNNFSSPSQPTDIEHATKKQLNDFYKWDHEQQQQKQDNSPAFNK
jgi:amino acid permease